MKKVKNFIFGLATLVFAIGFTACEKTDNALPSIANIAVTNAAFSQLEAAAVKGGVAGVLSNKNANDPSGNFTVFAPTNDAFARLGLNVEGDFAALNATFLTNTLLFHVSNGALAGSTITSGGKSASLLGVSRRYITRGTDRYINGSKILSTDVAAENGIVHVIDKVLITGGADIVQTALALTKAQVFANPELTFLVEAVLYADLAGALSASAGSPSFTVYAPTDAAFKQLGKDLGVALNVPADIKKLPVATVKAVLLNHVVNNGGKFTSEITATSETPLGGTALTYSAFNNGIYTIKGKNNALAANMVIPDVQVTNGVVHVIDRVLLP
jgi:uncharacterized surface protein with fasciclin (FAS1) repeats